MKVPKTRKRQKTLSNRQWAARFRKFIDPDYYTAPYLRTSQSTLNGDVYTLKRTRSSVPQTD